MPSIPQRALNAGATVALLAAAAAALAQPPPTGPGGPRAEERRPTVSVSATAQVSAEPDRAVVRLGALAEAPEAADAQNALNAIMQKVLEAVTGLGVAQRDIRTEALSLSPVYRQPSPQRPAEEPRISGYQAVNVVSVRLDDLDKIGDVIDAGIGAGANRLEGVSFALGDAAAARAKALGDAVRDARAQAEAIAGAMGLRIRGVDSVVAGGGPTSPPVPYGPRFAAEAFATPIQPGQLDVSASVTVTYRLGAP
jgi:uncharacterized protein YggE